MNTEKKTQMLDEPTLDLPSYTKFDFTKGVTDCDGNDTNFNDELLEDERELEPVYDDSTSFISNESEGLNNQNKELINQNDELRKRCERLRDACDFWRNSNDKLEHKNEELSKKLDGVLDTAYASDAWLNISNSDFNTELKMCKHYEKMARLYRGILHESEKDYVELFNDHSRLLDSCLEQIIDLEHKLKEMKSESEIAEESDGD